MKNKGLARSRGTSEGRFGGAAAVTLLCAVFVGVSSGSAGATVAQAKQQCVRGQGEVSCVFSYDGNAAGSTGSPQTFVVPKGVTQVTVEAWGAEGGNVSETPDLGGPGGYVEGTVPVDPGQTLRIRVGGEPTGTAGGYNGGGDGGDVLGRERQRRRWWGHRCAARR